MRQLLFVLCLAMASPVFAAKAPNVYQVSAKLLVNGKTIRQNIIVQTGHSGSVSQRQPHKRGAADDLTKMHFEVQELKETNDIRLGVRLHHRDLKDNIDLKTNTNIVLSPHKPLKMVLVKSPKTEAQLELKVQAI